MQINSSMTYRFYKRKYPKENELVIGSIKEIDDEYVYIQLLEYGEIKAMINRTDYTYSGKSKFCKNLVKTNQKRAKKEVFTVIKVDEEGGFIDVTKRKVDQEREKVIKDRYEKGKKVQDVLKSICLLPGTDLEQLYTEIVWPLEDKYKSPFHAFQDAVFAFDEVIKPLGLETKLEEVFKKELMRRFKPYKFKIKATFSLNCYTKKGVLAIKEALEEGMKVSEEDVVLDIRLIASPWYKIQTVTKNRRKGLRLLWESFRLIEESIKANGGKFSSCEDPHIQGDDKSEWDQHTKDKERLKELIKMGTI